MRLGARSAGRLDGLQAIGYQQPAFVIGKLNEKSRLARRGNDCFVSAISVD
jgi:hypothetical protein